jgi:hypothetical protein
VVYLPAVQAQRGPADVIGACSRVDYTAPHLLSDSDRRPAVHQQSCRVTAAALRGHHKPFGSEPGIAVNQQCALRSQPRLSNSLHALLTSTNRGSIKNMSDTATAIRLRQRQHLISDVLLQEKLLRVCQFLHNIVYSPCTSLPLQPLLLLLANLRCTTPYALTPSAAVGSVVIADGIGRQGLRFGAGATFDSAVPFLETVEVRYTR